MRQNKYTGSSILCVENTTENGINKSTTNGINKSCFLKSYTNGYVEVSFYIYVNHSHALDLVVR